MRVANFLQNLLAAHGINSAKQFTFIAFRKLWPHLMDKLIIFDTTLRDGEQAPGATMNEREKLEVARQLVTLGVDVIEAGFPISSKGDFNAVKRIASSVKGAIISALSRAMTKDIDAA